MLDSLTQRLTKVVKTIRGQARLTESNMQDMLREIRIALLEADVAIPVVKDLMHTAKPRREAIKTKRFIISPLKGCKEVDISFITL
jgi:signal recognition particle subunit SRP54